MRIGSRRMGRVRRGRSPLDGRRARTAVELPFHPAVENRSGDIGQQPDVNASDDEIMAAVDGDPARFGEVFDRHYATIHAYLARRLGRSRADDLAGEVFRVAFGTRARFDPARGSVRAWLYGIANNVLRRHLRDGERAERAWARLAKTGGVDEIARVDDELDARLRLAVLQQALDRLLPADREALILFAVEQLTYSEIAAVMDTPVGTVRSRISRARSQVRDHLQPNADPTIEPEGASRHG